MLSRALVAAVVLAGSLCVATPSNAAADVCSLQNRHLTITAPSGAQAVVLGLGDWDFLSIHIDGSLAACGDSGLEAFDQVTVRDTNDSVGYWKIALSVPRPFTFYLENDASDHAELQGNNEAQTWTALDDRTVSLDASGDAPAAVFAAIPALTTFNVLDGSDVLDATLWVGDTVIWQGGGDSVTGGDIADGGSGDDVIVGGNHAGQSMLTGHGGRDTLWPGWGPDLVDPGEGDDTVHVGNDNNSDEILASQGSDELVMLDPGTYDPTTAGGDAGPSDNDTWGAFETVLGSDGWDKIVAQPEGLHADGAGNGAFFISGPGDDFFANGTVSFERLDAIISSETHGEGIGSSYVRVSTATALNGSVDRLESAGNIIGSPGDDFLAFSGLVRPGKGNDVVGHSFDQTLLVAEPGPDGADAPVPGTYVEFDYRARTSPVRISVDGQANDGGPGEGDLVLDGYVYGGKAGDTLIGSPYGDYFLAGPGNDVILGLGGNDTIRAEEGNDTCVSRAVGDGRDTCEGGAGFDTFDYARRPQGVIATLGRQINADYDPDRDLISEVERLVGTAYADVLLGSVGHDTLEGRAGKDRILGDAGNDQLLGGMGHDSLFGGPGNDVLRAHDGNADMLRGGTGTDTAYRDRLDQLWGIERRYY